MSDLRTALAFLTRLPVGVPAEPSLARAAAWFPVVGLLVGGAAAGTRAAADLALPPAAATLLAVLVAVLLTGALHEDGLADVADALGAHVDRARRLEILRDPRVGAFGALALVLAAGLVVATVAPLDTADAARTLIVAHVLARWAILPVSRALPPARPDGAGTLLRVGTPALLVASALASAAALAVAGPHAGAATLGAATLAALAVGAALMRGLGGVTGDGYGATAKVAELAVCVTLAAAWS